MMIVYKTGEQLRADAGARAVGMLQALAGMGELSPAMKARAEKIVAEWEATFPQTDPKEAA